MTDAIDAEMISIGARIRSVRIAKNMSQAELADKANISLPHISEIELGKKQMLLSTFSKIIEVLNISADEILRADVPSVKIIYQNDIGKLLADCTPAEMEAILSVVKTLKQSLRTQKEDY